MEASQKNDNFYAQSYQKMLNHVNVKSKKITFRTTGISISKKKHRNLLKITNIEHIQCPIQTNIYPDESGAWFDGNE